MDIVRIVKERKKERKKGDWIVNVE